MLTCKVSFTNKTKYYYLFLKCTFDHVYNGQCPNGSLVVLHVAVYCDPTAQCNSSGMNVYSSFNVFNYCSAINEPLVTIVTMRSFSAWLLLLLLLLQQPFYDPLDFVWVSRYEKGKTNQEGKTNLGLLEQETVSSSGISWAICKTAPCPRQITMSESHHSVFYRPDLFLPPNQQHQSTEVFSAWLRKLKLKNK